MESAKEQEPFDGGYGEEWSVPGAEREKPMLRLVGDEEPVFLPNIDDVEQARQSEPVPVPQAAVEAPAAAAEPAKRLASLDIFRGLTIVGMLLVNNIALDTATPRWLVHAGWNQGVHFADMVFPWFLLIVGVAMPYAMASHRRRGLPTWLFAWRVLRRAALLVALGCLIDSSIFRRPVFDLSVLQIIGLAYFGAALFSWAPIWGRLLVAGGLLGGYAAAILRVAVPHQPAGIFLEGNNIIHYLNTTFLDRYNLAGAASVAPTVALVLLGTVFGEILRSSREPMRKGSWVLVGGFALVAAGAIWNLSLPFNKPVWTPSYVLFAGGWGAIVLGCIYLVVDVVGWKAWAYPLTVFGMNAIVAYVAPILTKTLILQQWTWRMPDGTHLPLQQAMLHEAIAHAGRFRGGVLYTAGYIVVWWLVLVILHRKRLFLRV